MIINHDHVRYRRKWHKAGANRYNGAFYYSKEICRNIIPNVKTGRNWVTINIQGAGCDHAIVFIHNNLHPEHYDWLKRYKDLVLVCGVPETCDKVSHLGTAIYLPLSVDVDYVKQFRADEKVKGSVCFAGRKAKTGYGQLPDDIDYLYGMKRQDMLPKMAKYEKVYAVGRCAIEAKILGCEILPYDDRFPDVDRWQVLDNKEAAKILQEELWWIDGNSEETL